MRTNGEHAWLEVFSGSKNGDVAQRRLARGRVGLSLAALVAWGGLAEENVYLTEVPDYQWHAGCFGTASGNLVGYWDRHGLPDLYTGPTGGGLAPLNSYGDNTGIFGLWASKAGRDGRPVDEPGHMDDYWVAYESTMEDPYVTEGRTEHEPDSIGDFTGQNQKKWKELNGECDGNIDGYSFAYWDDSGARRTNYVPGPEAGTPTVDLPSGLRGFCRSRGYGADAFTQLSEFNPKVTGPESGFSYEDVRAEIDAGYPILVYLQDWNQSSRPLPGMPQANPNIHGMMIYGYFVDAAGDRYVYVRTSWATGTELRPWTADSWTPSLGSYLPVRGVIGFHPKPKIVAVERSQGTLTLSWQGPNSELDDAGSGDVRRVHQYVVERSDSLGNPNFTAITEPMNGFEATIEDCCPGDSFFRVSLQAGTE